MRLQDFIIGLMALVLFLVVSISLVLNMYSVDNYNIDLSNDNDTQVLEEMQTKANTAYTDLKTNNEYLRSKAPGGESTEVESATGATEGDFVKSSMGALTSIPTYLEVFKDLISNLFNKLHIDTGIFFWFFTGSVIIVITLLLLSSVLRNVL